MPVPGQEGLFGIDSFFDVFLELTLESSTPLPTTRGPIRTTLVPAPAPVSLLVLGLAGLARGRMRRHAAEVARSPEVRGGP